MIMNFNFKKNEGLLNWLASLSLDEMNSLTIMKAVRLTRSIKQSTGNLISLNDKLFLVSIIKKVEEIESPELYTLLHELIIELLNIYEARQSVDQSDLTESLDVPSLLQQL